MGRYSEQIEIICPLIDSGIEVVECVENQDCIDGLIKISSLPEKFKSKQNWKDICANCRYHEID